MVVQLNNNHRYLIQYMLKNGITTVENAQKYCRHISQGEIENMTQLKTLIIEINREISKQFYKLVFNVCEVTNKNCLIWLNTKNDDISKLQITYSALELEYFHAIFQEILRSVEHRITFIVCLNISSTLTAFFSRENGQKVLTKWLHNGYFVNKNPYVYLGPRLILEFTSYLKTNVPDSVCALCSELVFWGKTCECCHKTIHSYCLEKYLENQNNCPSCLTVGSFSVDEDEVHDNNMEVDETEEDETFQGNAYNNTASDDLRNDSVNTERDSFRNSQVRRKNISEDENSSDDDPNQPGPSSRKRYR